MVPRTMAMDMCRWDSGKGDGEGYKQQQQQKLKVHVVEFANIIAPDKGTHYYEAGEKNKLHYLDLSSWIFTKRYLGQNIFLK